MADPKQITMEGSQITGWKLIKAKHNADGDETEPAKLGLALEVPLDRATPVLVRLARMFRNGDSLAITVQTLSEQLELADRPE